MFKLTRRKYNASKKIKQYVDDNSFILLTEPDKLGISQILIGDTATKDYHVYTDEHPEKVRKELVPALKSNRQILFQDSSSLDELMSLLHNCNVNDKELNEEYLRHISKDIRYDLYPYINPAKEPGASAFDLEKLCFTTPAIVHPGTIVDHYHFLQSSISYLAELPTRDDVRIMREAVYISGPISNNSAKYDEEFSAAEISLAEAGFCTINPVKLASGLSKTLSEAELWKAAMDIDLSKIIEDADYMALLPDKGIPSRGVAIEKAIAKDFNIETHHLDTFIEKTITPQTDNSIGKRRSR